MHAYCISGSDTTAIEQKIKSLLTEWHVSEFNTLIIEKEEEKNDISIKQVRDMTKQLSLTPAGSPFIVAIIKDAHRMTIPAQNAMLKILEEPPQKAKIILTTSMPDALLQTILSRCERCTIGGYQNSTDSSTVTLESLFSLEHNSVTQILASTEHYTTHQDSLEFVDCALQVLHTAMMTGKTAPFGQEKCATLAKIFLKTRQYLSANVNPKLALDNCFLEAFQGRKMNSV
jgi:hypothetical protein